MDNQYSIGIISEGVTDQIILEAILVTYLGNKDLPITRLQPKENESGNWDKVFKYCKSADFKQAFHFLHWVIIQVDTDFMRRKDVPKEYLIDIENLSTTKIIEAFRTLLIDLIGDDFYEQYAQQIIFAIAVDAIECWLLPIYYQDNKAKKTTNCLGTLNQILPQTEGFAIDEKKANYYEKIAKHFKKRDTVVKCSAKNESFKHFLDQLSIILSPPSH